jgi:hypothetical protein
MARIGVIPYSHVSLELGKKATARLNTVLTGRYELWVAVKSVTSGGIDSHNLLISSVELRGIEPRTS